MSTPVHPSTHPPTRVAPATMGTPRPRHGMSGSPEYKAWIQMRQRCTNPRAHGWAQVGARGVSWGPLWDDFRVFYADMGPRPEGTMLRRVDKQNGYTRDNCVWAPRENASAYTRERRGRWVGRLIEYDGRALTIRAWAEELGITARALTSRLNRGVPLERALTPGDLRASEAHRAGLVGTCADCGAPLSPLTRSPYCRAHRVRRAFLRWKERNGSYYAYYQTPRAATPPAERPEQRRQQEQHQRQQQQDER